MRTNLTAKIVMVTPEVAKNYLTFNSKNRQVSEKQILFLTNQMKNNLFLENGEAIIFDNKGELKDGQHRLLSIIRSNKSYYIPIINGVEPKSMATYDTGKNRKASDVLHLNGFKYPSLIASFIVSNNMYNFKNRKQAIFGGGQFRSSKLTNQQVLDYCSLNYYWLKELISSCSGIGKRQSKYILSINQISIIAYRVGGKTPSKEVFDFIKHLLGLSRILDTAPSYLYTKIYNSKINKEPLNFYWILGMSVKAWNYYIDGNPSVKYFKFSTEQDIPKVKKL